MLLEQKGEEGIFDGSAFHATLKWKTSVDLDLHCFVETKGPEDGVAQPKKSFFGKLLGGGGTVSTSRQTAHVSHSNKGSEKDFPWVKLDKDAGVGDVGGDNEENIRFPNLGNIRRALIVANIYNKNNATFNTYDGKVVIKGGSGEEFEVPLNDSNEGSWCAVALLDNTGEKPVIRNVNETMVRRPSLDNY